MIQAEIFKPSHMYYWYKTGNAECHESTACTAVIGIIGSTSNIFCLSESTFLIIKAQTCFPSVCPLKKLEIEAISKFAFIF